jgi:hypothetical protein
LVTTRSKRWNGDFDSLPTEYLKGVMAKMLDYGDRVQFSFVSVGGKPNYQVLTTLGKTMAFDKNHHLLRLEGDEFVGTNASATFTLEQVKKGVVGMGVSSGRTSGTRVVRAASGSSRSSRAKLDELFAAQRYEYFKNNRQTLPPTISQHSDKILELMKQGKSVEEAYGEVIKKYF